MKRFAYRLTVKDGTGGSHIVDGKVESTNIVGAVNQSVADSFNRLTNGSAIFGRPGQGGCKGPYTIQQIDVEEIAREVEEATKGN